MVATRDDVTYITCLHSVVAVFVHQFEGLLDMTFVVLCGTGGLMVHQDLHTLGMGIVVEHLQVEVGVGGHKVEDIALPHVCPVLPTDVPTFNENLVETILGCKVDIALHLLVVGGMTTVGLHTVPVDLVEFDAGEVVGIVPRALADNHLPPYATVLCGMDP